MHFESTYRGFCLVDKFCHMMKDYNREQVNWRVIGWGVYQGIIASMEYYLKVR